MAAPKRLTEHPPLTPKRTEALNPRTRDEGLYEMPEGGAR